MGKIDKFLIIMGVFLLLINIAHAASFDVVVTPIKDKIVVDEIATFNITVQNNLDKDQDFTIKKAGYPFWDMYTEPLQSPINLKVPAEKASTIKIFVRPLYITSVDTYTLDAGVVLAGTGEEQKAPITIGIKSTEPLIGGYIPTVVASISISPESIDPREKFSVKIVLNNQNPINYTNLTINIESGLFKDVINTALGPKEDKTIELAKKLDGMTVPQQDRMVVSVYSGGRIVVNPIVKEFEIKEYTVQEEIPKEESFLKIKKGFKVTSNNQNYKGVVKAETTPIKNLLLTTYPRAAISKENGKQYLVWQIELGPDRTMSVYITENYRPIVVVALAAIAAVVLYFLFRSPMVVRKGIANVGMSEGGISDAKVVVRVKNRSAKQLSNIEVIDHVPHIAHVEKELSIGSMQPHSVLQHPKRGVIIKWAIEALEPGDERVLSYRMKSRLSILGEFNLPAATARCKVGEKVVITNSNRVSVGG